MNEPGPQDPFAPARREAGVLVNDFGGEVIPMILRHGDVREAARDWRRFSSDAPFRVPIPSEEDVRRVRQLPIETDPPEHTEWRAVVEPFFQRATRPEVVAAMEELVGRMLAEALGREAVEVVREFALPLQSRALALLLDVPEAEAETWIGWGTHVFRDAAGGGGRGSALDVYLEERFARAEREGDGRDFFSALVRATFRGRPLTPEERLGFANLTFAGGRDTIIQTVALVCAHFAADPEAFAPLRGDARAVGVAAEEFVRVLSPLTHIGRVCPVETAVHGVRVPAGTRVSLCWASANHDETVFAAPGEVRLDRRPNPHLAYGAGPHVCLGAPHARLLLRTLLAALVGRVDRIDILEARPHVEQRAAYTRATGYDRLLVRLTPRPVPRSP